MLEFDQVSSEDDYCNTDCNTKNYVGADMDCPPVFTVVIIDETGRRYKSSTRFLCHTYHSTADYLKAVSGVFLDG